MSVGRLLPWAAAVVLSACGSSDAPSPTTPSPAAAVSCAGAIDDATAFLDAHPGGPLRIDAGARERLDAHVRAVERACEPDRAADFGSDVLEPWSARGAVVQPPDADGGPLTTVPPGRTG